MKRILILDDNHDYLEMISLILRKDYDVVALSTVSQIHEVDPETKFDAIIMDYNIGIDKAPDVIPIVNTIPNLKNVPKMLVTGSVGIDKEIRKLEFDIFLQKPFSNKDLKMKISQLIN